MICLVWCVVPPLCCRSSRGRTTWLSSTTRRWSSPWTSWAGRRGSSLWSGASWPGMSSTGEPKLCLSEFTAHWLHAGVITLLRLHNLTCLFGFMTFELCNCTKHILDAFPFVCLFFKRREKKHWVFQYRSARNTIMDVNPLIPAVLSVEMTHKL